jgi:hypothetical protein
MFPARCKMITGKNAGLPEAKGFFSHSRHLLQY